ncbi:HAD family phosphatase [Hephaestia sp. GCM10023244]|uniref:HAD family phosphatase n=1 Tax=unclassified Hephaestia TaxID=2631281 RepID=UPI002572F85E|nr:HAD family phosphatase [Hephaestia sp. MAHUQ-44]
MRTAFCFDLDGTVTRTEILPCIASELGISDEMETLTRATMDGHIDFIPSFRLRCLILGAIPPERIRAIVDAVPLNEDIFSFIRRNNADCFLVTGNLNIWIDGIAEECGATLYSSTASFDDGKLSLGTILDKGDAVADIRSRGYDRVVAIGDGANDMPMFRAADVSVAFGGVHAPSHAAISAADYVIHEGVALCSLLEALS